MPTRSRHSCARCCREETRLIDFLSLDGVMLAPGQPEEDTFEPKRGPRRYMLGGNHVAFKELAQALSRAGGRRHSFRTMPRPIARLVGHLIEGVLISMDDARTDDSRARNELGFSPRPAEETLADTVDWMIEQGHVAPRL
jgi:nucleoside-diphosphate-sugar epimerase